MITTAISARPATGRPPCRPPCITCDARPADEYHPRCGRCEAAAQRRVRATRTRHDLLRLVA